ncbi:hypothetical protein Back2_27650 [Nocardioides baekrokdamisoli]|uniref:Uncharacterized protein n=1 Tax=Nocardioides baekrokdamisoli TaxID=1804624 RepID=A0A3G9J4B0_9ACTN|nr:hypothetical protein Back2_27650 [Nocardioides baekrokdamisoli]
MWLFGLWLSFLAATDASTVDDITVTTPGSAVAALATVGLAAPAPANASTAAAAPKA